MTRQFVILLPVFIHGYLRLLTLLQVPLLYSPGTGAPHHRAPAHWVLLQQGLHAVLIIHMATDDVLHRLHHLLPTVRTHSVYLHLGHL